MIRKGIRFIRRAVALPSTVKRMEDRIRALEQRNPPLIWKAAWFAACEMIEGDYVEFGTYKGNSFKAAYQSIHDAFAQRIAQQEGEATEEQRQRRSAIFNSMRFVALDSFEGLPELRGPDLQTDDFAAGQYAVGEAQFRDHVVSSGVPQEKLITVPGWFSDTSNQETWDRIGVKKAAIIWIDGDLYASARDALGGVRSIIQPGTVIIFDDWFAFKADPNLGEQKAFAEWRATVPDYDFVPFHSEGVWRTSFVAVPKA